MKQLFVAWIAFQRRPTSMEEYFNYDLTFLSLTFKNRLMRPLEYMIKACQTLLLLTQKRPDMLWIQLAPTPLIYIAHLYRLIFNRKTVIIADCHNSMYRSPWIDFPGALSLLNRCNLVLVHNSWVREQALRAGVKNDHLQVLETRPANLDCKTFKSQEETIPRPWILLPCSFDPDEPINFVIDAARQVPEITFVLTGKLARAQGIHDLIEIPANIKLVGFVPKEEFDRLLYAADIIMGLTKRDGVQLSVANEAVGVGKAMILSDTEILRELFYKGAIYVDSLDAKSIAQGCKEAIARKEELTKEAYQLREERNKRWISQAEKVKLIIRDLSSKDT